MAQGLNSVLELDMGLTSASKIDIMLYILDLTRSGLTSAPELDVQPKF